MRPQAQVTVRFGSGFFDDTSLLRRRARASPSVLRAAVRVRRFWRGSSSLSTMVAFVNTLSVSFDRCCMTMMGAMNNEQSSLVERWIGQDNDLVVSKLLLADSFADRVVSAPVAN
jgi:hypothetical protein